MQFEVEPARIADGVPIGVSPPQRRCGRLTVCARGPCSPGRGLMDRQRERERKRDVIYFVIPNHITSPIDYVMSLNNIMQAVYIPPRLTGPLSLPFSQAWKFKMKLKKEIP